MTEETIEETPAEHQEEITETTSEESSTTLIDEKLNEESKEADASKDKPAKDEAAKTEDGKPDEEASDDDEAEAVTYDLEIQEGMEIDEVALGSFKELAGKMNDGKGLSQKDAQSLVDLRAEMVKGQTAQWDQTFSEWRGEIHSDAEIGGDKFTSKTIPNVMAAAERYGDKEMISLLRTNKMYGENPSLIRLLNRVGETLSEDQVVRGQRASQTKDAAEILYPTQKKG